MKVSLPSLRELKREGRPIVMITAYDHPSGRIVDRAGVDLVLVGDSAANVVLGHGSTVPATMDEMTMLTAAVSRGVDRALVIGDLPFMSYQVSDTEAVANAGRLIKQGGADVVKLEAVPAPVAATISSRLEIPTIGIGSGPGTDGQVLVLHDMLGIRSGDGPQPRFVKRYAEIGELMSEAVTAYAGEVRSHAYPGEEHTYSIPQQELDAFEQAVDAGSIDDNTLADW